jgi:hypothetical protein
VADRNGAELLFGREHTVDMERESSPGIPVSVDKRDHKETLLVNYLDFQKGKVTYHNSRQCGVADGVWEGCELYCLLNLLNGILQLINEGYRKARGSFGRREEFFNGLRFSLRRFLHKSWEDFMLFVTGDEDDG